MNESTIANGASNTGIQGMFGDWSSDQRAFKTAAWDKSMMWLFLLSDIFVFGVFLLGYMAARMAAVEPWPDTEDIFGMQVFGYDVPLLLIAIMTFILISSSGTMALAVKYGYEKNRRKTAALLIATAVLGASFLGMQVYEWAKLISDGVRPWENPFGAPQFGAAFFMITGFHGFHVTIGVILLLVMTVKVLRGSLEEGRPGFITGRKGHYGLVEVAGLYWHFVDLVWVFIFAFFYLW
ncbi:MAG: cytochrome c oxidase subunit 3 [Wenzhouxiangellaceae bacterium]